MKNAYVTLLAVSLLTACGRTEKKQDEASPSSTAATESTPAPKPQNCLSIIEKDKLGKSNEYQESAKSIKVTLTLDQDTSTMPTAQGCYFNNSVTVLATKKSGSRVFKRTLLKDDLLYFTKIDEPIQKAILQNAFYKPTFNGQKYITLTMRLKEPGSKKTMDYTVYMNYFGEIVKVK
ncbi:hypothetical protein G8759_24860 [Spirosoma aureum]|uniref:DUF4738 domain-containing protein n=1 Tax=Spirosoma aureum TaxID=2692134 RepID=A0A6G9AT19_9BACT|nr:hypothetical protein [Spirosoma aureum]QIP15632.1 hypothetical protein G8759_24860 [Spirosoma aureum]